MHGAGRAGRPVGPIRALAALGVAAAIVAGACSSSGAAPIAVSGAWARASSAMAAAGAAYMTIRNNGSSPDALIGATSPAARTVEVHETVAVTTPAPTASGGGMASAVPSASGDAGGGMMGMQPIPRLEVPAGSSVELKPGSYHIMLIGLNQELKVGGTISITLKFEKAGEVTVSAEIRAS